ncbi:MAG: hypothetical protein J5I90_11700 [Caldilineales bacterium]|nr:hypothetical protein [Caldilineales bacterium]
MPINVIHGRIATAALLFMLAAGVWGLWRWRKNQPMDQNYFGVLIVGELLLIVQMLIGVYMWLALGLGSEMARPGIHILYGIVTALTLPAVYAFTQGRTDTVKEQALYAAVCLFLAAMVWRSGVTAALLAPAMLLLPFPR